MATRRVQTAEEVICVFVRSGFTAMELNVKVCECLGVRSDKVFVKVT